MPKPRKDSAASVRIAVPTASVPLTMTGPSVFGRMCRNMIRASPAPDAFAASTYSFSRKERKTPRTTRAMPVQKKAARMIEMLHWLELWVSAETASRIASAGSVSTRSVMRMSRLSSRPPK